MIPSQNTHQQIDQRLLAMVTLCVGKIDQDPTLLAAVKDSAGRIASGRIRAEWFALLERPWSELRQLLLDPSEAGNALRQNVPFSRVISAEERQQFIPAAPRGSLGLSKRELEMHNTFGESL